MIKNRVLSLRENFLWTFAGNVVYNACQWGMIVVIAKLGTPEMVGQFVLAFAISAPIMMFANMQLRGVQATDAKSEYGFGDYLGFRILSTAGAFIIILFIAVFGRYGQSQSLTIIFIGLAKSFEAVSDVIFGHFQKQEKMDKIAKSMIIKGILSLGVLASILLHTKNIVFGVIGVSMTWAIVMAAYDLKNLMFLFDELPKPRWRIETMKTIGMLALPLGIIMTLVSLNTNIPRYFIEHYRGGRSLGIFGAMVYIVVAGNAVVLALGQSATPKLAKYFSKNKIEEFFRLLTKMLVIGVGMGVGLFFSTYFFGRQILAFIYTPEYSAHVNELIILMGTTIFIFAGSFLGYANTAARLFREQVPLNVIVCLVTIGASYFLIPKYGLMGAVYAMLISAIMKLLGAGAILRRAIWNIKA